MTGGRFAQGLVAELVVYALSKGHGLALPS